MAGNHLVIRADRRAGSRQFGTKLSGMRGGFLIIAEHIQTRCKTFHVCEVALGICGLLGAINQFHQGNGADGHLAMDCPR